MAGSKIYPATVGFNEPNLLYASSQEEIKGHLSKLQEPLSQNCKCLLKIS
jgi:hypothetical protein